MTDKKEPKRLAFGVIDAAAISRDNLLLTAGMALGFASRVKSLAQEQAPYAEIAKQANEMLEHLLMLAGVDPNG